MKIGILTHPLRLNYGGILQNYALQIVVRNMGYQVLTIDRHNDKSTTFYLLSFIKRNIWHYIFGKKRIPTHYYIVQTRKQFLNTSRNIQQFISKHIQTTHYLSSASKLKQTIQYGFDCYLVGSDQVWQKMYVPSTFLDFLEDLPVRRVAYAVSGKLDWLQKGFKIKQCQELAQKFKAISVREESAIYPCKKYLNVDVTHVLDPTMLLNKDNYLSLLDKPEYSNARKDIMMSYILDNTIQKSELKDQLCKKYFLTLLEVKPKEKNYTHGVSLDDMTVPPIEEWIVGYRDANFVFTDSFHGMIFAIIFNKQFLVVENKKRGNTRFLSVLNLLEIENRLIDENCYFNLDNLTDIDYDKVNAKLEYYRLKSLQFLENALK